MKNATPEIFMPLVEIESSSQTNMRIYLMRNGEPCDRLTGAWSNKAFHDDVYRQIDLNQPASTVNRKSSNKRLQKADLFKHDAPLTMIGSLSCKLVARAFYMRDLQIRKVFSAPALRCVQSAAAMLAEMQIASSPTICVEPGLLDPLVFYWKEKMYLPNFMSIPNLIENGYNIDEDYKQVYQLEKLKKMNLEFKEEEPVEFYKRIAAVMSTILDQVKHEDGTGNILIVCHAPTIDAIVRHLLDRRDLPHIRYDLYRMGLNYRFSSLTVVEQSDEVDTEGNRSKWELNLDVIPPITYSHISTMPMVPSFPKHNSHKFSAKK
ncbi:protein UBASH3A like protein [Ditylenchus destructor]|nr:protein UBASH3A like protein [Ditylenchus destructor]